MSVPLIDLQAGDDAALARRIDAALREAGFFALVGHGVPQAVFDAAFDASHRFFALAEADKKRWHIDGWPVKRGFDPIGWQSLDVGMPPDVKESFYTGNTSYGPNQWPDEALVPGFRAACEAYSAAMRAAGAAADGAVRAGAGHGAAGLRRLHARPHLHHAAAALPAAAGAGGAGADRLRRAHRLGRADAAGAGRCRRPAGAACRRQLARRAADARRAGRQHRRHDAALDQRPLALDDAPRHQPVSAAATAGRSPISSTSTPRRASHRCLAASAPATRPATSR